MRELTRKPIEEMDIDKLEVELDSRDDIPQLLQGLQYIFLTPPLRQEVFTILDGMFPPALDLDNGRPGMAVWSIFVMGVLRLSLNCDYDRLHNLVNNHLTIPGSSWAMEWWMIGSAIMYRLSRITLPC
jgi:IS5 family transposase